MKSGKRNGLGRHGAPDECERLCEGGRQVGRLSVSTCLCAVLERVGGVEGRDSVLTRLICLTYMLSYVLADGAVRETFQIRTSGSFNLEHDSLTHKPSKRGRPHLLHRQEGKVNA